MTIAFITLVMITLFRADQNDSTHAAEAYVEFRIMNAGVEVTGVIEAVRVDINFDEKNLHENTIIATARTANIRTGILIRDKHLQRGDYFHADLYPEITLTSIAFKKTAQHKFLGTFILKIKNVTREVTIPFSIRQDGNTLTYSGTFEIDRLDFGLGEKSLILSNVVKVFVSSRVERSAR
jgi:polyisoprenoid-binding protein YceI